MIVEADQQKFPTQMDIPSAMDTTGKINGRILLMAEPTILAITMMDAIVCLRFDSPQQMILLFDMIIVTQIIL